VGIVFAERLAGAEPGSILDVRGLLSDDSSPNSLSPRFSSSSSLINPRTRRTILPTTSSRGWAAARRFPTSWTRCMNFCGSGLRMEETIRRRRRAVAIAQGRECRICRLLSSLDIVSFQVVTTSKVSNLTHAIRVSIDCSTGSVERDWRKEVRPGVSDAVAGAISGLNFAKALFSRSSLLQGRLGNLEICRR
jgi:hypothetical protein